MNYYIGAYYLLKLADIERGSYQGKKIYTCSFCCNESYYDYWSLSWAEDGKNVSQETKALFNLNDTLIKQIQQWTDKKFGEKIGWGGYFLDLQTLLEYKQLFFPNHQAEILTISFAENERKGLLKHFNTENHWWDADGIYQNLQQEIIDNDDKNAVTLGFDLIGCEFGGNFHSFHCYNLADKLIEKFDITINEFGLIEDSDKWAEIIDYANDSKSEFSSIPWFYVKVKKIIVDTNLG